MMANTMVFVLLLISSVSWTSTIANSQDGENGSGCPAVIKLQVEQLQTVNQVQKVAFSAGLLASGDKTLGVFDTFLPLVYKHIFSNFGNAYNPQTGFFTAPVKGAYHFEFYIGVDGPDPTAAVLVKNGENVLATLERQESGFSSASNAVTLILEAGDAVYVQLWPGNKIYDNGNHHSTFSGHLLFTV